MRAVAMLLLIASGCSGDAATNDDASERSDFQTSAIDLGRDAHVDFAMKIMDLGAADLHKAPPDLLPACGLLSEPCCMDAGAYCTDTSRCNVNAICKDCGWYGGPCCANSMCDPVAGIPMVCVGGSCQQCGYVGQPCCNNTYCVQTGAVCRFTSGAFACESN